MTGWVMRGCDPVSAKESKAYRLARHGEPGSESLHRQKARNMKGEDDPS